MFSRIRPLALISAFQPHRAVQSGRRNRPVRRPPDHRSRTHARFRLEGLEDRCLLSGISSITEFSVPGCSATPSSIVAGPDGNLWFTEGASDAIGVINPTTDAISSFTVPTANANPAGITVGPDGNLWFTESLGDKIGVINPTTHAISEFPVPTAGARPMAITAGSNGNLWFTEFAVGKIGEVNPTTHAITEFKATGGGLGPIGITAGPDGNLWFTKVSELGDINPKTDTISQFTAPVDNWGITAGADGNLWYARDVSGDAVGRINPTTDAITLFSTGSIADSQGITSGPDGNVWFTGSGQIGQMNLTTDAVTAYTVPYDNASPLGITTGPDGNLWFEDTGTSSIGVARLTTSQLVVTTQPPSSVTAGGGFGLTVTAENSSGNLLSSFDGTVTVALDNNPGGATLGGTLSATASGGVATFSNLSLTTAASGYTLQVSASGLGRATTGAMTVTPAAPSQVAITEEPPASVTAGSGLGLQASVEDAYGNVVTTANNTVSVALVNNPTGATLGGTLSVTASNGVAAFSGLTLTTAASGYTLQASSSGLTGATTSAITVTPAAATQVVITQQPPASVVVNTGFGLQASIEDAYGNVVTSASSTVKVALSNNPTGAKLGGTLSVKASHGVATFSGLTLNKAGSAYTLALSSSGLAGATTSPITVTSTGADIVFSAAAGSGTPDPLLAPLVLDSPDLWDGLILKKRVLGT